VLARRAGIAYINGNQTINEAINRKTDRSIHPHRKGDTIRLNDGCNCTSFAIKNSPSVTIDPQIQ
jgi:hypothetical protein